MFLLRLMTEVTKFESQIKLFDAEIDIKLEEKEAIQQTVADATADLQALITEQKRLFAAWNAVIVTMSQRDSIYADVNKELSYVIIFPSHLYNLHKKKNRLLTHFIVLQKMSRSI